MDDGPHDRFVTSSDCWRAETWHLVHPHLPAAPARVVDLGCGPDGGVVPALLGAGYDAIGVDPEAPQGDRYLRVEFERAEFGRPVDAIVACSSLHHVDDLDRVLDRAVGALAPSGSVVVVEWGWDRFDQDTARWCFDRLGASAAGVNWLGEHRERWTRSGLPWAAYLERWAAAERLHSAPAILSALDARFSRRRLDDIPYFFCDLVGTPRTSERAAIAAGRIRATGVHYVGGRTEPLVGGVELDRSVGAAGFEPATARV